MALNFPDSPTLNQVYTDTTSGFSYQWDGVVWQSYTPSSSSQIRIVDNISGSFNGSTDTFSLAISGVSLTPLNPQQLRVVLGGIVQEPGVDYTVSNSNIIFTTPPSTLLDCSIVSLGPALPLSYIDDGSVTPAKLSTGGPSWNTNGDLTISGNVSVGGTITYEDVTNVDSIGLSTFRNGLIVNTGTATTALIVNGDTRVTGILTVGTSSLTLNGSTNQINGVTISSGIITATSSVVGSAVTINSSGINVSGVITATNFVGNGSGLTGAGSTVANDTTTNATFYPVITQTTSGTITASKVSTSKLTFNPSSGTLTSTQVNDAGGNLRTLPNNAKSTSYVLAAGDVGELINITTGGVTVPSGVFSAGNSVTIYNNSGSSQTITQGSGVTLRLAGVSTTGNRTLDQRGLANVLCVGSNEFVISGAGLS